MLQPTRQLRPTVIRHGSRNCLPDRPTDLSFRLPCWPYALIVSTRAPRSHHVPLSRPDANAGWGILDTSAECSVGMLRQGMVEYLARVPGRRGEAPMLPASSRIPAYCTAFGRVLLASLTDQRLSGKLSKIAITPLTPSTVTLPQRLRQILVQVRADGYALYDQEFKTGSRAIAVPVRNSAGAVVVAICVSTSTPLVSPAEMTRDYRPILKSAAVRLGRHLPFVPALI